MPLKPLLPVRYWVLIKDVPNGPFCTAELHVRLASGEISGQTKVCIVGGTTWSTLAKIPGIFPDGNNLICESLNHSPSVAILSATTVQVSSTRENSTALNRGTCIAFRYSISYAIIEILGSMAGCTIILGIPCWVIFAIFPGTELLIISLVVFVSIWLLHSHENWLRILNRTPQLEISDEGIIPKTNELGTIAYSDWDF